MKMEQSFPKRRFMKFRSREITQKEIIQNSQYGDFLNKSLPLQKKSKPAVMPTQASYTVGTGVLSRR